MPQQSFYMYLASSRSISALSVFSHGRSISLRPEMSICRNLFIYGLLRSRSLMMAAGLRSKCFLTSCTIFSSGIVPVPEYQQISIPDWPLLWRMPAGSPVWLPNLLPQDSSLHIGAAYAAERSTFVGSLPENAPPPCLASTAICIDDNLPAGKT